MLHLRKYIGNITTVFIIMLVYSCTPPLYIPNTANVPVLLKQGDLEVGISTGSNGWDAQLATAVTDNIGVMLNGSFANTAGNDRKDYHKHHFTEMGIGYTYILNTEDVEESKMKYFISGFVGGGMGKTSGVVEFNEFFGSDTIVNSLSGDYSRIYFQPFIGMSNKHMSLTFSTRISRVSFSSITYDLSWASSYDQQSPRNNIFYEPTVTFKIGGKYVKFFTQIGVSVGHYGNAESGFKQRPSIGIIGIQGSLNWKK